MSEVAQIDSATMLNKVRDLQKTGGNGGAVESDSGKIVALRSGAKIRVSDAVWSCDNSLLRLIIRGDGVDVTVPRECVELVIKSETGEEVFTYE